MARALELVDRLSALLAAAAMAMLAALVADMVYEVVSRRVFNAPTLWAYDIAYMLNGAGFLLAAGHTLRNNGHIRIDFLSARLPARLQDWINAAAYAFLALPAVAFLAFGAWAEWREAYATGELDPASPWKPLLWPLFAGMLLGVAALLLQMAAQCVRHLRGALGLAASPLAPRGARTTGGDDA